MVNVGDKVVIVYVARVAEVRGSSIEVLGGNIYDAGEYEVIERKTLPTEPGSIIRNVYAGGEPYYQAVLDKYGDWCVPSDMLANRFRRIAPQEITDWEPLNEN